ncbi:hypothetical protein [Deinococcus wulumuqiensis]|uniref:hypothetical protein n=1 Tax=Deinococcus wulumuqiensis TaxID=980427 RepID=UPI00242EEDC9|nr:hypothetical protein [Deinococcus wulumuqiensis]
MGNQQASKFGRPLSELSQVDWASLTHAYGSAENVPAQLEAIAAGDEQAYQEAFGNLWHQWTTYSATPHAIPFLIGILEAGTRNAEILDLLGVMGRSNGEHQEAVLEALELGLPLYSAALKGEAEDARAAVYLLSAFISDYRVVLALQYDGLNHPDKSVQAATLYYLRLYRGGPVKDEVVYYALTKIYDRALSLSCALFQAHILRKNTHPDAARVLEDGLLINEDELEEFQEQMAIDPDDIFEEVAKAAKAMGKVETFAAAFRAKAEATGDDHWLTYLKDLEG